MLFCLIIIVEISYKRQNCLKFNIQYSGISKNNNRLFIMDHSASWSYGSPCILQLLVTLSAVNIDHPLSLNYESDLILLAWITLRFLSFDHPVFFDYGHWSPCILLQYITKDTLGLPLEVFHLECEVSNPSNTCTWLAAQALWWVGGYKPIILPTPIF